MDIPLELFCILDSALGEEIGQPNIGEVILAGCRGPRLTGMAIGGQNEAVTAGLQISFDTRAENSWALCDELFSGGSTGNTSVHCWHQTRMALSFIRII